MDLNIFKEDILNTVRDSILILNYEFKIVYANTSFYTNFKVKPEETLDKCIYELGNGQWDIPDLRKLLEEILPNKISISEFKVQHVFPNVGRKIMVVNARQLKDGTRKEKYIFVAIEDITEKIKLLESSFQANKLASIGQLSSGIAHGLSSPLTGIHNFLNVYAKEEPEGSERHEELKLMLEACTYMNKIVKSLTYFARTTKDEFDITSLKDVIDSTLSFTERQLIASNIFVTEDVPGNIREIMGNKSQLQHVLLNILMNSKEAIEHGGKIDIKARNDDKTNSVVLEVIDSGKGIQKKDLPHLFEPFFTSKTNQGSGLGLSSAYGIIANHHGTIRVESAEGKGTKVIIKLPFAK